MATTYPLATLAATVTAAGISAPTFAEIYASLQATFQGIYGSDSYIDPDSQDGQLLAAFARVVADSNDAAVAVYNAFSPSTAQNAGLSSVVKINGLKRNSATPSQALLLVVGEVGTTIGFGVAGDAAGNRWLLPGVVEIPVSGQALVQATSSVSGATEAEAGAIDQIMTPTRGWQSVTNPEAAVPGAPVEPDPDLRQRQARSTALPSRTVLDGIVGAIEALDGVVEARGYENDTGAPDANGLPAHSTAIVAIGGSPAAIAAAYLNKKTPGAYTHGDEVVPVVSASGVPYNIRYFEASSTRLLVQVDVKARAGYTTATGARIKQALADYVNGLGIGDRVDLGRLYLPAQFYGASGSETFDVNAIRISASPATPAAADVEIAFNARATLAVADVTVNATP